MQSKHMQLTRSSIDVAWLTGAISIVRSLGFYTESPEIVMSNYEYIYIYRCV